MAEAVVSPGAAITDEEVRTYRIHVPTKHLDLTRQKLELTRLPREGSGLSSPGWWEPKPLVESLIDFWLEKFSWRDHESTLNTTLPQFRTAISLPLPPSSPNPTPTPSVRIHFLHARSSSPTAIPLLLIPPFPLTNLSLGHLLPLLTSPPSTGADAAAAQSFHVVIPSLPGLGFSDPLPAGYHPVSATAHLLDSLMVRLGYTRGEDGAGGYLASATAPRNDIDYRILRYLSLGAFPSCRGVHLISPPLTAPGPLSAPLEWARWRAAAFWRGDVVPGSGTGGYCQEDFDALDDERRRRDSSGGVRGKGYSDEGDLEEGWKVRDPNTVAYALCDSPVGALAWVLRAVRGAAARGNRTPGSFGAGDLVSLANLVWLPGPEGMLRFWGYCNAHKDPESEERKEEGKPKVGITVFISGSDSAGPASTAAATTAQTGKDGEKDGQSPPLSLLTPTDQEVDGTQKRHRYAPPAWGNVEFDVVYAQRVRGAGGGGGLLPFVRPDVVVAGIRGLAKEVLATDSRLAPVVPLESIVVAPAEELQNPTTVPPSSKAPDTTVAAQTAGGGREGDDNPTQKDKGKEKETDQHLAPPPIRDPELSGDGESPDTLVEGSSPPLGRSPGP